jgi:hypothetical protein
MKKLLFLVLVLFSACTPVRYVYVDQKDSVVKKQRVIYDNLYVPSPFFFNYGWGVPFYNPIIIQRQRPIVIPQRQRTIVFPQRPVRPTIPNRTLPKRVPRERN